MSIRWLGILVAPVSHYERTKKKTLQFLKQVKCSLVTYAPSVAWKYRELPQAIICRPGLLFPDFDVRRPSSPDVTELLTLPQRRQVVGSRLRAAAAAPLRARVRLTALERSRRHPLELPPQLGLLLLGEPRRVGRAAEGLAVRARGRVQAAVEHVDELALEPGEVAAAHANDSPRDDLTHVAGGIIHPEHAHSLLREVVALPLRQVKRAADVLAGLAEEPGQGQLVVQLVEERGHVGV